MNAAVRKKAIRSVADLLAYALAMENEAVERYQQLADQMEVHHNADVAQFFRRMAEIEGRHVAQLDQAAADQTLPHIAPWEFDWEGAESPESVEVDAEGLHYLATPHHAIRLALAAEQRAVAFYERVAAAARGGAVKQLAERFAGEEREHVRLLSERLAATPEPERDWHHDPDPPTAHE